MGRLLACSLLFIALAGCSSSESTNGETQQDQAVATASATTADDEANADEGSTPVSGDSPGYLLAAIDQDLSPASVETHERKIAQVAQLCGEPEMSTADKVAAAVQILDQSGITESTLWVMDSIIEAIPSEQAGSLDCGDVVTALVAVRLG